MSYEPDIIRLATQRLERRRENRARRRDRLERELYLREPRLGQLDRALRGTMVALTDLIASPTPIAADGPEIAAIRQHNLELQQERAALLAQLGHRPEELEDSPHCLLCRDSGWGSGGIDRKSVV